MITLEEIQNAVAGHSIVRAVDVVPKGHVRMETAFLYPDGSSIDVFVPADGGPLLHANRLTDLGQTIAWLSDVQVSPWMSKKRQAFLDDAIRLYEVQLDGGSLVTPLASSAELIDRVVRLGQACVRVADLSYTRRSSLQTTVTEEVEEIIVDADVEYDASPELEGKFGSKVRVDFLARGKKLRSAILTLASANSSTAHNTSNEIFRKWYDLHGTTNVAEQRVTVLDDRNDVYRDDDLRRLRELSDVVALSDRRTITDLIAA